MGVVKYCNKCHNKISLREMPNGAWLPFEFNSNELHECSKINTISNTKQSKRPTKYDIVLKAIDDGVDIIFSYKGKSDYAVLQRHITPKEIKNGQVLGYCHLRKDDRIFNLASMHHVEVIDKDANVVERIKIRDEKKNGIKYVLVYKNRVRSLPFYYHENINFEGNINQQFKNKLMELYLSTSFLFHIEEEPGEEKNIDNYSIEKFYYSDNISLSKLISDDEIRKRLHSKDIQRREEHRRYNRERFVESKFAGWIVAGVIIIIIVFLSNI